jgi:hypothetical protein
MTHKSDNPAPKFGNRRIPECGVWRNTVACLQCHRPLPERHPDMPITCTPIPADPAGPAGDFACMSDLASRIDLPELKAVRQIYDVQEVPASKL